MSKQTYHFAQYRTDSIADCIAERKPFTTYGNLSGRPIDNDWEITPYGWESSHPAWHARLREIQSDPYLVPVYAVWSFRTIIAVLVRSHHASDFEESETPVTYWEIDAAARSHSVHTSKAVMHFEVAIGQYDRPWTNLGNMTDRHPEHVYARREIGREWLIATRLTPHQRFMMSEGRGLPMRAPTRRALERENLIQPDGFLTALGLAVSAYCA